MNAAEQDVYKSCLKAKSALSQNDIASRCPDLNTNDLLKIINRLLKKGLLLSLQDGQGRLSFRAVGREEAKRTQELDADEEMVYRRIEESRNEGIWVQSLRQKTNLHITVINKCIKTLEQKQLIKAIKSVKFPTRKIYMLFRLQPSIEVTGGPWYTDNELDTEFINTMRNFVSQYIHNRTYPRRSSSEDNQPLYPTSYAPRYPSIPQILQAIKKSKLTSADLSVENVEELLNTLIYDGTVQKLTIIPQYGDDESSSSSASSSEQSSSESHSSGEERHRKRASSLKQRSKHRAKKRRDRDSSEASSEEASSSSSSSDSELDEKRSRRRDRRPKKKVKASKSRKRPVYSSESEASTSSSASSTDSDRRRRKSSKKGKKKLDTSVYDDLDLDADGSAHVYRSIQPERMSNNWAQAPCGDCPIFDFCSQGGPVNASNCKYYDDWLDDVGLMAMDW